MRLLTNLLDSLSWFTINKAIKESPNRLGDYEIRKYIDGTYRVTTIGGDNAVRPKDLEVWHSKNHQANYCSIDSLKEAKKLLVRLADEGVPL